MMHLLWKVAAIIVLFLEALAHGYYWHHYMISDVGYSPMATAMVMCTGPAVLLAALLWFMPKPVRK